MLMLLFKKTAGKKYWLTLLAVFFSVSIKAAEFSLDYLENGLNELIYRSSQSIVTIEATNPSGGNGSRMDNEPVYNLISTGIVYDSLGHILAVASSVTGRSDIKIKFEDQIIPAQVQAVDYQSGLAILKMVKPVGKPVVLNGKYGCAGQMILALGNVYGLRATPSLGFCAGIRPDGIIQFTAPVIYGTLGCGLFNLSGQLVGVFMGNDNQGNQNELGLAVPAYKIPEIANYLITKGDRLCGYLGLTTTKIQVSPPIVIGYQNQFVNVSDNNLVIDQGVLVNKVVANSPAEQAGLQKGDLLFSVNGKRINSAINLVHSVQQSTPGTIMNFDVLRQNSVYHINVKVGEKFL
ncbi:MAG: serine protease, partial [FCB group bacterium]|nr:serine protease [FCB group bacterium]